MTIFNLKCMQKSQRNIQRNISIMVQHAPFLLGKYAYSDTLYTLSFALGSSTNISFVHLSLQRDNITHIDVSFLELVLPVDFLIRSWQLW